jgi:hypothetical protein
MSAAAAPARAAPLRTHVREMGVGLALGLLGVAVAAILTEEQSRLAFAVLLAGIGFVYIGFATADGRPTAIAVQAASAAAFLWIAYAAVQLDSDVLLGAGFLAHGVWDAIHHEGHGPTRVRTWYPPFCAVADVVIGIPLIFGWV